MTDFKCIKCKWYDITGDKVCTAPPKHEVMDTWFINYSLGINFKECIKFEEK